MRAVIKTAPGHGNIEWAEMPTPEPGPGEVQLELVAAGLCHTDLGVITGAKGPGTRYNPDFPLILGHEFVGRVTQLGAGVNLEVGTRVVGSAHLTCGKCKWCLNGHTMLCDVIQAIGLDVDGIWAERFVVPARNLVPVPDDMPDRLAVLAEPFAVTAHAVDVAELDGTENICVIGPGSIGLMLLGALTGRKVTVVGRPEDVTQAERALALGAERVVLDPDEVSTMSMQFDVVIETAGHPAAVALGTQLLGRAGRMVCVGLPAQNTEFSSARLAYNEQTLRGIRGYDLSTFADLPARLGAAPGLQEIVTHTLPLIEHQRAFDLVENREAIKVLMHL